MNFTLDQLSEAQQKLLQENQQLVGAYAQTHADLAALKAQRKALRKRAEVQLTQLSELKQRIETVAAEIGRQTPAPDPPEPQAEADLPKAESKPQNGPAPALKSVK